MKSYPVASFTAQAAQLPSGMTEAIRRDLGVSAAQYLARSAAAIDAVTVVERLKDAGVKVLGSRLTGTTLVVNVTANADTSAVTRAGAVAVVGKPRIFDLSKVKFTVAAAPDLLSGSGYVFATNATPAQYGQCSLGFNGFDFSSGTAEFATAGHCVGEMDASSPISALVQASPGSNGALGNVIGTAIPASAQFGSGYDSGLVAVARDTAAPVPSAVTWGGGTGSPTSSAPLPITSVSSAIVGGDLCKSGSRTGWTCGSVEAVDQSVSVGGTIVNSLIATTCVLPGDSGGSALVGQSAVGITSSTSNAAACDANSYSAFFPMISDAGAASVTAKYASSWEPQVTVAAPIVNSATGGSSAAPGTIRGTLSTPSPSSNVRVYLDGSSTPAVTVSASSGSWTAQLPTLTTGSHSYAVVATWGKWSQSPATAATGSFTVANPRPLPAGVVNPLGVVDSITSTPGQVTITGWTFDPDSTDPIEVHVYLNGVGTPFVANLSRPDVNSAFAGSGPNHGYSVTVPVTTTGLQTACTFGINVGPGANTLIGCPTIAAKSGAPFGYVDSAVAGLNKVTVSGWTIDPDTQQPAAVQVLVDGTPTTAAADGSRPDVGAAYSGYGSGHGYSLTIPTTAGPHRVCVTAVNVAGPGANTPFGCTTVTAPGGTPFGFLDAAVVDNGTLTFSGWAIDPDTAQSIPVHLYLDGQVTGFTANKTRSDVASIYPDYGPSHGFVESVPVGPGPHSVCIFAINIAGAGSNPLLGCIRTP